MCLLRKKESFTILKYDVFLCFKIKTRLDVILTSKLTAQADDMQICDTFFLFACLPALERKTPLLQFSCRFLLFPRWEIFIYLFFLFLTWFEGLWVEGVPSVQSVKPFKANLGYTNTIGAMTDWGRSNVHCFLFCGPMCVYIITG